jgi:hypothetical protein
MWQVGDEDRHAAYLAALTQSHGYATTVRTWYNGEQTGELLVGDGEAVESGSVRVSATSRERRSLSMMCAELLWPTEPSSQLSSFGGWITVHAEVSLGTDRFSDIPLFAGRLMRPTRLRTSGRMTTSAVDPMWLINRAPFEALRNAPATRTNVGAIGDLILEVFPRANIIDLTRSTTQIPAGVVWDARSGSRGWAIDALAAAIGAEVYALPTSVWPGGDFVIRPVPQITDPVSWELPPPPGTVIEEDEQSQGGDQVVNRWVVLVERPDQVPLSVPVTDDSPVSPTRYAGPMGKLADFYSSPLITSEAQGRLAGAALLARSIGAARTRRVKVIANPALDAGDVLAIPVTGEATEYHIADDFEVSLSVEPPGMDITTRSTGGNT